MTLLLAATALASAVFVGGVEAQKHFGATTAAGTGGGFAAFARGGGFSRGGGGGASGFLAGGFGGGATVGTVTLIKGTSLYVTDSTGNTVIVKTPAAFPVSKTVTVTAKSIHPGDTVSFVGTQSSNGSYTPRAITITSGGSGSGG